MSTTPDDVAELPVTAAPARNVLKIVWQRKSLVLLGLVVGLVIGALVFSQQPPVYQSGGQVLVVKRRSDALPVQGGDPRMGFYEDYVSTHLILIRSPVIIDRAVKKADLGRLQSFQGVNPAAIIGQGLKTARDSKDAGAPSNIILLSYNGPVAEETGVVLDAIIDAYRDFLDETYRNVSDNTLELITRARDLLEKDLKELERRYRDFREKAPLLIRGKDGGSIHTARISEFETRRSELVARASTLEERIRAIESARKDGKDLKPLIAPSAQEEKAEEDRIIGLERAREEQMYPLLVQEQALLEDYGEDHPQIKSLRRKIEMTRDFFTRIGEAHLKDIKSAEGKKLDPIDLHVQTLQAELLNISIARQALERLLGDELKEAKGLSTYELQDETFRDDIARTSQIYEQTIKRLQEINLVRDGGGFDARVIAPPGVGYKVAPSPLQYFGAAGVLGLLLGCGLAYLADLADTSFRTPEEIRRRLGLPIFGHVPYLEKPKKIAALPGPNGKPVTLDPALVTIHEPRSVEAEAFRSVRTSLYFSTHGEGHKVIQVTSPMMGDGKSTTASNVAIAIAQSGKSVILLDADFRRPNIHKLFGLSARKGLASVVGGDADVDSVILPTAVKNLSIVPCGPRPSNPAELLTSPRFEELLEEFRQRCDFVIVDTPPVLAVTDPCAVAARVDGVLLTVRLKKNSRPPAERAREMLLGVNANLLGIVVNASDRRAVPAGYAKDQYAYGYEYESADDDEMVETEVENDAAR